MATNIGNMGNFSYLCVVGRLLAIDFGKKRCGIAVTDPMQIIANGLATVETARLVEFITGYAASEQVDLIIVGYPTTVHGEESESMRYIRPGIGRLRKALPNIPVEFSDERFTSVLAHKAMIAGGMKKMARRDKAIVDEISASIILNDYLENRRFR